MIAMPDPSTFSILPWRPEDKATGRMFCDVQVPGGEPYEGDPRWVMRRALERAKRDGLRQLLHRARAGVLLLPLRGDERRPAGGARQGRLLRPHDARRGLGPAARDGAGAGAARHPRRVQPPRGRALAARGRHALRGRAEDGRRLHDVPHHREGVRDEVRLLRDLHAEAAVRRERVGHARAPVAVQGRPQRVLRRQRPVLPVRRGEVVHRRPAQARARDVRAVRAVGELLQAARARLRGAGVRGLVAAQPLRADPGAAVPPGQGAGDALRDPQPRPRVQPVPVLRGAAAGGPGGNREGLRAARADGAQPLPPVARTSARSSASSSCPRRSARRSRSRPSRS